VATESPHPGFAYDPATQINLVVWHYVAPTTPTTTPTTPTTSTSASGTPTP
jgi:hypothetical protein